MKRKIVLYYLVAVLFVANPLAQAQQVAKMPRVAYVTAAPLSAIKERTDAFRQGLRELDYVEGKNILVDWRGADGKTGSALAALIAEVVQLKVDVIVSAGAGVTRPAKQATSTIPIVMAQDDDPVGDGTVASLARPGGNITGLSTLSTELSGKRLEILKDVVPRLSQVAVFSSSSASSHELVVKETELASKVLGLKLQLFDVLSPKDIEISFREAAKRRVGAALMDVSGIILTAHRKETFELAIKNRLPVIYSRRLYVEEGALMSYGVSVNDLDRRAAIFVDKILKGRKPADLPVEQPMRFEFVVNLNAAKAIGLTVPPNVLVRANKVIR